MYYIKLLKRHDIKRYLKFRFSDMMLISSFKQLNNFRQMYKFTARLWYQYPVFELLEAVIPV